MKTWKFWRRKGEPGRFVLCLDGGGMRGVIPVRVLMELEKCLRERGATQSLVSYFDLVAGTSTGGLIALALTCSGRSLEELDRDYRTYGPAIFPQSSSQIKKAIRVITTEKYPVTGLETLLKQWFGDVQLSDAAVKTLIMTYDVTNGKELELKSWEDSGFKAFEAGRATSAAPTYFAPFRKNGSVLLDGGVIANNPSLFAYTQAKQLWKDCADFTVLSVGTAGRVHRMPDGETSGILNWADNIVPLYSSAQKRTVDSVLEVMPGVNYLRIEDQLKEKISMDDTSARALKIMTAHAEDICIKFRPQLEQLADALLEKRK